MAPTVSDDISLVGHVQEPDISDAAYVLQEHNYFMDQPLKTIQILGLNVCGLRTRIEQNILQAYVNDFDIICLTETKTDYIDPASFTGYNVIHATKLTDKYRYGGIHGIAILLSNSLSGKYQLIPSTYSDSVMWVKLEFGEDSLEQLILGAVYVPHEGSKYHENTIFDDIANDCIFLKAKYNAPICLIGDFNARTGLLKDFVETADFPIFQAGPGLNLDDAITSIDELESLGICTRRINQDRATNNNGRQLIEMCKSLDLLVVNGRIGKDKNIGKFTCDGKSVIDYVIASAELFPQLLNFYVDSFDQFMSDKHCPICLEIKVTCRPSGLQDNLAPGSNLPTKCSTSTKICWKNEQRYDFAASFDIESINVISRTIDSMTCSTCVSQVEIDEIANRLKDLYRSAATKTGMIKNKKSIKRSNMEVNAWFNADCRLKKSNYIKMKKKYKSQKNDLTRSELRNASKQYKQTMSKAKREFYKKIA